MVETESLPLGDIAIRTSKTNWRDLVRGNRLPIPGFSFRTSHRVFGMATWVLLAGSIGFADEAHTRYFDQLRQRGLFSLAEGEAISRLAADHLSLADKTNFSIELSRTLTEHAGFVSDEQREELWQRARSVIQKLLDRDSHNPRSILLEGQLAAVSVSEGDWLRAERVLRPFDETLLHQARTACTTAIELLQAIEKSLAEPPRDATVKKPQSGGPSGYELRALLHQARWQLGQSFYNLAELDPPGSVDRTANAVSAEQSLRRLTGVADEPLSSRAKVLLVSCARLKGDLERASEMLNSLEKIEPKRQEAVLDELTAERIRLLLELRRPDEAAERLLKLRNKRQRLTGELWFLQTQSLIALRDITLEKQQQTLAERLSEQIGTTIQRCEEQVGGFWARRCRQLWDNAQTTRKYGPELDGRMQQARMDFTAGRIDAALTEYAAAEKVALQNGKPDLAMELGFTRASILLDQKQNESSATEFFRLATNYPAHPRAAQAHLLGSYSLGRLYDEKKTQQRREAYTEALDQHLQNYPQDATVNEARFLKAQLEEHRLQATQALPLYLEIEPGHARGSDAISGAARCYEIILRRMIERHLPTSDFEREATDRLTKYLTAKGDSTESWTDTHADVALRLISILLMSSAEPGASKDANSPQEPGRLRKLLNPGYSAQISRASQWLERITAYIERRNTEPDSAAIVAALRQRSDPFRIIVLSVSGNPLEAERLLKSSNATPMVLFSILEGLNRFASTKQPAERAQIASLQLKAAEQLLTQRDQFSSTQRAQLDQNLASAYIATGQIPKAIEILKRLADNSAKDVEQQRQIAHQMSEIKDPDAITLSKQCWRRVESLTKAGTTEWMTARLEVIRACVQLRQLEEGRKLLQVTKVLYPDLGGESFKAPFDAVERELNGRN